MGRKKKGLKNWVVRAEFKVERFVYVDAPTAEEAKNLVESGEWSEWDDMNDELIRVIGAEDNL